MPTDLTVRPKGRPRDTSIDAQVLDAARQLLADGGFDATTVQAVAKRAGVHASAIYRRWPSRIEIIEQAVFPGLSSLSVSPSGDLRKDLRRFIRAYLTALSAPAARAAIPGLLSAYESSGRDGTARSWLAVSARPQFQAILNAAPSGAVDPAVDPDDVFDMLLGAVLARVLVPTIAQRNRPMQRLVDLCVKLVQPGRS